MDNSEVAELEAVVWDLIIIGAGFAATVNGKTLQATDSLPTNVLIIGELDPWANYIEHRMGQYNCLLTLPGYRGRLGREANAHEFANSKEFALQNSINMGAVLQDIASNVAYICGVVEEPLVRFNDLWVVKARAEGYDVRLKTKCVDICTGPGRGRVFSPTERRMQGPWAATIARSIDDELLHAFEDRTKNGIFVAEDYLHQIPEPVITAVVGNGPLAAGAVEAALEAGCPHVYWIGDPLDMGMSSFPDSERYDGLVHDASTIRLLAEKHLEDIGKNMIPRNDDLTECYQPKSCRLTIVLGHISIAKNRKLTISEASPFQVMTHRKGETVITPRSESFQVDYEAIVVSASSENILSERRSAAHILSSVAAELYGDGVIPLVKNGMFVGLTIEDRSVRVLGSPSRNRFLHEQIKARNQYEKELNAYEEWHDSLCAQARMLNKQMGITVGAASIARANDFYCEISAPDKCVQTAVLDELPDLKFKRASRISPFEDSEFDNTEFQSQARTI